MEQTVSLKDAEKKVFITATQDGLWDIWLGCIFLIFVIAPFLSVSMGDFWSTAVHLPFYGIVFLAVWLIRKKIIKPRMGIVKYGKVRKAKLMKFSIIMLVVNIIAFILGIISAYKFQLLPELTPMITFSLIVLVGFTTAAVFLGLRRLFFYGLMTAAAPIVGEWLYYNWNFSHHGFPVTFGVASGIMIITGLVIFIRLLKRFPALPPDTLPEDN
jgi:hypothetical protein